MRLPVEQIKAGLLHPERDVRTEAVYYFARSRLPDPTVMPLVIEATNRFGLDAFASYSFFDDLVQTDATITWMIQEIERIGLQSEGRNAEYHEALVHGLTRVDAVLLKRQELDLLAMKGVDEAVRKTLRYILGLIALDAVALWRKFNDFCDEQEAKAESTNEDYEWGCSIVDAMCRHPDQFSEKMLAVLAETSEQSRSIMAVRFVGKLRLDSAVPRLLELVAGDDDWLNEEIYKALATVGSDVVVSQIAVRYSQADTGLRIAFATTLEEIRTDLSVETCLRLLSDEKDDEIQSRLLQSALMNFSSAAIEPARQYILNTPKTPEVLEVRDALLVTCKLTGETFPEHEAWQADTKNDTAFRKEWYKDHPLIQSIDLLQQEDDEDDFEEYDEEDEEEVTIVRRQAPVGRNDPCPCGSGKKFKKCCYGKIEFEESDMAHSMMMSDVRPNNSAAKYPVGTVALYGPDDRTTTKIVAGIITEEGSDPILERWVGTNVTGNPKIKRQMQALFEKHKVKSVVTSDGNMGCPHEEGQDFPHGADCPFCPFWAGKQGSNRED